MRTSAPSARLATLALVVTNAMMAGTTLQKKVNPSFVLLVIPLARPASRLVNVLSVRTVHTLFPHAVVAASVITMPPVKVKPPIVGFVT